MNCADKFCALRKQNHYKQEEVAAYLGISRGAYGMYEIGKRKIDIDTMVKLCRFYSVTPNEILGFDESP